MYSCNDLIGTTKQLGNFSKHWLLSSPKINRTLVIFATRPFIYFNVRAVWWTNFAEFLKRRRWRMIVLTVRVVLLSTTRLITGPLIATVIHFKIKQVPKCNSTNIIIFNSYFDIRQNNFLLKKSTLNEKVD